MSDKWMVAIGERGLKRLEAQVKTCKSGALGPFHKAILRCPECGARHGQTLIDVPRQAGVAGTRRQFFRCCEECKRVATVPEKGAPYKLGYLHPLVKVHVCRYGADYVPVVHTAVAWSALLDLCDRLGRSKPVTSENAIYIA